MVKITLFSQIVQLLPRNKFQKLVNIYQSDKHHKGLDSWIHLLSMIFCHLAQANSVRDISNGFRSTTGNLNHLGIFHCPSKSSVSYINKSRDWHLFKDFYFELLDHFQNQFQFVRKNLKQGYDGLKQPPRHQNSFWNKIPENEQQRVVETALKPEDISP